jgi:hypothetical protein
VRELVGRNSSGFERKEPAMFIADKNERRPCLLAKACGQSKLAHTGHLLAGLALNLREKGIW